MWVQVRLKKNETIGINSASAAQISAYISLLKSSIKFASCVRMGCCCYSVQDESTTLFHKPAWQPEVKVRVVFLQGEGSTFSP